VDLEVEKEIPKGSLFDKLLDVIKIFSQILNLPCQTPLGSVAPDLRSGANHTRHARIILAQTQF